MADAGSLDNLDRAPENATVAVAGRQPRGTRMGFARVVASILFVIALPIALVTTNIRLLANAPAVYDWAFDQYDAESVTGISRDQLDAAASGIRDYFNNGEKTFYFAVTIDGLEQPIFNATETRHMEDVKSLMVTLNRVQEISVIFVLAYVVAFFIWARDGEIRQLAVQTLLGLALGVLVFGGVGIVAAFGFDAAFERFHDIAFANDFWQLSPREDHLIQMFPEEFWRDMTVLLGAMLALQTFVIAAIAGMYLLGSRGERTRLASSIDMQASPTQAV